MKNKQKIDPTEHDKLECKIQQEMIQWFRNTYCLKHHQPRSMILSIPNEGRMERSAQLIATGLYPGAGDFIVFHPIQINYFEPRVMQAIFFEVKRPDGVQSDKQKAFQDHCTASGIPYYLVRSKEQFQQVIKSL